MEDKCAHTGMTIRKALEQDLPRIMEIYAYARNFMKENGNPNQWGPTNWPPEDLIRSDIRDGHSYVVISGSEIAGVFFYIAGKDVEPVYRTISDGHWLDGSAYGVIHRIASNGKVRGLLKFCTQWAYEKSGHHLRIDTHPDNKVMQHILSSLGFCHCGTIYVEEDNYPRMAYEKSDLIS